MFLFYIISLLYLMVISETPRRTFCLLAPAKGTPDMLLSCRGKMNGLGLGALTVTRGNLRSMTGVVTDARSIVSISEDS